MLSAVEKYAPGPGKKCAIDTLFEVLRAAGINCSHLKCPKKNLLGKLQSCNELYSIYLLNS